MHLTLIPQRRDDNLVVTKLGDTLIINDINYDFSVIPEGASLPASATDCLYLTGNIERITGILYLTLILPHGPNPSQAATFPSSIINPTDGLLELPK